MMRDFEATHEIEGKVNTYNKEVTLSKEKIRKKYIYHFVTRLIDIMGSIIGLVFLSPVFLFVAYRIKKEEPNGTILYSQMRVGRNGEQFRMYKFRSMCMDADKKLAELLELNEVEGAMFKMHDDPRITKVGKFIRKTSIDELPQFWNVLRGNMSIVGSRPPLVREVAEYTDYDKQRLYVKPGCTGLWQVSGRNDVGFHDMVSLDIQYIQHMSIRNDIKIILKTVGVMLRPNGAY